MSESHNLSKPQKRKYTKKELSLECGVGRNIRCEQCRRKRAKNNNSFAVLSGGACLMNRRKRYGGPHDDMDGFLDLTWHGDHNGGIGEYQEVFAVVDRARDVRGGQFERYFCSIPCLRRYLNDWVDELETRVKTESAKMKKRAK